MILILAVILSGCDGGTTPTRTDSDLINGLLDQFQSGMINENFDLIASLCEYPLYWTGTTFNDAGELIAFFQGPTTTIEGYDVFELNSRIDGRFPALSAIVEVND